MAATIEEMVKSVDSTIIVGIEISNNSKHFNLTSAAGDILFYRTYADCGVVQSPPPPTVQKNTTGTCVLIKTPFSLYGIAGVLSYDFGSQQISLLFSNPFDSISYDTLFALYVPEIKATTDRDLYTRMYSQLHESDCFTKAAVGRGNTALRLAKGGIEASATMSNVNHKAILKLEIHDHSSSPYKPN